VQVTPVRMGFDNAPSFAGAAQFPGRISVLGRIDVGRIDVAEHVAQLARTTPLVGFRLTCVTPAERVALTRDADAFWQAMAELGLAASIYAPDQLAAVGAVAARFPTVSLIVDHVGADMAHRPDQDRFRYWPELFALADRPNVFVKASGLTEIVGESPPFATCSRRLHELMAAFGADRLMWAANYPNSSLHGSYTQTVRWIAEWCPDLTRVQRGELLGGTARRAMSLPV